MTLDIRCVSKADALVSGGVIALGFLRRLLHAKALSR